ncbi:MAG: hypothetical protein AB8B63_02340 [Granulosicoccus sp.]
MTRFILPLLLLCAGLITHLPAIAQSDDCPVGSTLLEQSFSSGAQWTLCAEVNASHGLTLSKVRYRAPGDTSRSVLHLAHLGQILMHYHDQLDALPLILNPPGNRHRLLPITENNCDGERLIEQAGIARLCSRIEDNIFLSKYATIPALHSKNWELSTVLQREFLTLAVSVTFSEDGVITPAISFSGISADYGSNPLYAQTLNGSTLAVTRTTILATWRLVFDLDTPAFDKVEQYEFPLLTARSNRRPMQVRPFAREILANINRENFRGWRIRDPDGPGYYLDPSNSGFDYRSQEYNWAQFDLAVTRFKACEQYATNNSALAESSACGRNLDNFINGETLQGAQPVLWFTQSRTLDPSNEDWPIIRNFRQSFSLMPFDWTTFSPFDSQMVR